jgi:hypothetical protein
VEQPIWQPPRGGMHESAPGTELAYLPCALKAAIGIGKRTLDSPRQSGGPQGPQQGPRALSRVRAPRRPKAAAWPLVGFAEMGFVSLTRGRRRDIETRF